MKSPLKPSEWKLVFSHLYLEKAKAKGIKIARRHRERLGNGFVVDYVLEKYFKKDKVNGCFWWVYSEHAAAAVIGDSVFLNLMSSPTPSKFSSGVCFSGVNDEE